MYVIAIDEDWDNGLANPPVKQELENRVVAIQVREGSGRHGRRGTAVVRSRSNLCVEMTRHFGGG